MAPFNKDLYALYLRKSRTDLELEAMGEGETLQRHHDMLMNLASKLAWKNREQKLVTLVK